MSILQCRACGKKYRVTSEVPGDALRCQACGGALAGTDEALAAEGVPLPFSRLAGRVLSAGSRSGGGKDEGSLLGGIGSMIMGDRE
jgi:hypothetical protein